MKTQTSDWLPVARGDARPPPSFLFRLTGRARGRGAGWNLAYFPCASERGVIDASHFIFIKASLATFQGPSQTLRVTDEQRRAGSVHVRARSTYAALICAAVT